MENEENIVEESTNAAVEKTYTQKDIDEMKSKWEGNFQKKLDKAIARKMREVDDDNFKREQLIKVQMEKTGKKNLDELLDLSEKQYEVKIPRTRTNTQNDIRVLGENDAKEILDIDEEYAKEERERLANLERTEREEVTYNSLSSYLDDKASSEKRKQEILENELDEEIINSSEFHNFESKFAKETSLKDIYDLYGKSEVKQEKPFSAGSLKDIKSKQTDEFYTLDEFQALTAEDLKDDKVYEKAMRSAVHLAK